jgi:hypothetical protein
MITMSFSGSSASVSAPYPLSVIPKAMTAAAHAMRVRWRLMSLCPLRLPQLSSSAFLIRYFPPFPVSSEVLTKSILSHFLKKSI